MQGIQRLAPVLPGQGEEGIFIQPLLTPLSTSSAVLGSDSQHHAESPLITEHQSLPLGETALGQLAFTKACRSLSIHYIKVVLWLGNISEGVTRPDTEDKTAICLQKNINFSKHTRILDTPHQNLPPASASLWRGQSTDCRELAANATGYQKSQICRKSPHPQPHNKYLPSIFQQKITLLIVNIMN